MAVGSSRAPWRPVLTRCATAAVVLALPGCTALAPVVGRGVRECESFDVPLSVYIGPSRKELRSRVIASGVEETFPFVSETTAESMVIVGFTPLGTKSFTLTRKADDVEIENFVGAALKVPPRNVMADVLAMSLPSSCADLPDGDAPPANFDEWRVTDTCGTSRPLKRIIAKAAAKAGETPEVEIEVEYRPEAIVVRQKRCKYVAAYVLQVSAPIPGVDVRKEVVEDDEETAAPATTATPAPAAAATPAATPTPAAAPTGAPAAPPASAAPSAPLPAAPGSPVLTPAR